MSFVERFTVLGPYLGESTIRASWSPVCMYVVHVNMQVCMYIMLLPSIRADRRGNKMAD